MKINKYLSKITFLALAVLLTFAASAEAQKRKPVPKKPVTNTTTTTNSLEIKQNAEKTAIQLKNVTTFLYKLGGIASAIEALDNDAKANKLSKAQLDKFNQQKQAVITSIRNLKAGLAALEVEFRTKPSIKLYLLQIQGVTDLGTQSEDLATAGRFADSGRVLVSIVEKLADTLAAMP
jgi:chaperonin cofactor prefoldin